MFKCKLFTFLATSVGFSAIVLTVCLFAGSGRRFFPMQLGIGMFFTYQSSWLHYVSPPLPQISAFEQLLQDRCMSIRLQLCLKTQLTITSQSQSGDKSVFYTQPVWFVKHFCFVCVVSIGTLWKGGASVCPHDIRKVQTTPQRERARNISAVGTDNTRPGPTYNKAKNCSWRTLGNKHLDAYQERGRGTDGANCVTRSAFWLLRFLA